MPRTLKQVAVDMANAFTRWQLWQGGGSSTLSDLTDVELTDLQTDDVLQYDGNKWINAIIQGGGGNVGAKIDTIWSNPNPLSTFSQQTITIDTNYDLFIIDYRATNTSSEHFTTIVNKVFNRTYRMYCNNGTAQTNQYLRSFTLNENSITFDEGLQPGIAWNNALCIPTIVYGVKFAPIEANFLKIKTFVSEKYSLNANGGNVRNIFNIATEDDYIPIGIIQIAVPFYSLCTIGEFQISGNNAYISINNFSSIYISEQQTVIRVLYARTLG